MLWEKSSLFIYGFNLALCIAFTHFNDIDGNKKNDEREE